MPRPRQRRSDSQLTRIDLTRRLGFLFAGALLFAPGQWLNYPTPGTPRGADGKPNLSAKTPRAANGKPDLSGVWRTAYDSPEQNERLFGPGVKAFVVPGDDPSSFSKYFLDILVDFPPDKNPMRPAAAELFRQNTAKKANSSSARCLRAAAHRHQQLRAVQDLSDARRHRVL